MDIKRLNMPKKKSKVNKRTDGELSIGFAVASLFIFPPIFG